MDSFGGSNDTDSYQASLEREKRVYADSVDVHRLPEIFHYWSNRHLQPKLLRYGLNHPNCLFKKYPERLCRTGEKRQKRFVSLGAGNCDLEIETAVYLRAQGITDFTIECVDLNARMLERSWTGAASAGVGSHLQFVQGDLNVWNPEGEYDAAFANQSLHHILNLERLFDQVRRSLRPEGLFIISDIIGRNGHRRWPEALDIVREFWRTLPPSYRFNCKLGYYDEQFEDWDCSVEGFEGVRAQDILPLLLDQFHFQLFIPFGNAIDPFIDRAFGPNFDAGAHWDTTFIDRVHETDDREIGSGRLTPTHMLAVAGKDSEVCPIFPQHMSPRFCLRSPEPTNRASIKPGRGSYEWRSWPHDSEQELKIACHRLGDAGGAIRQLTTSTLRLNKDLDERTLWALRLEKELEERTVWALRLEKETEERTRWALQLNQEIEDREALVLHLQTELQIQTSRARLIEEELHRYIHNPFRFAIRLARGFANRLRRLLGQKM